MGTSDASSLVRMCIVKVAQNMDVLEKKVSSLPVSLLKDLLPHLNIYYLDRIETAAATKGISTSVIWAAIWRDLDQMWRWKLKAAKSCRLMPDVQVERRPLSSASSLLLPAEKEQDRPASGMNHFQVRLTRSL
ncbi:leucine-rich repeat-containing protein 41-like [Garra rufa]|uniref:leucine-rich repeat-containing protein 41-like n=1 Tax=Garra rufa TaxID=137080 RepID=UPI003CCEA0C4